MRILFILKHQLISGGYSAPGRSSGLFNSARYVCDMLRENLGQDAKLVVVTDNNDIEREVNHFEPELVVIEALWVVPEKFRVLHRIFPRVTWWVRNHSAMPFLAHEGTAIEWLLAYPRHRKVFVGCNDHRAQAEFAMLGGAEGLDKEVKYLPNYYPPKFHPRHHHVGDILNVACLGAIRPLKNQLIQAVAAITYAEAHDLRLHFHVNGTRLEGGGEPILKNLRALFRALPQHKLKEHRWMERPEFLELIRRMDVSMQCSYTETFNLVSADCVMNGVPVVVSPEVHWVSPKFKADPNDSHEMARTIQRAIGYKGDGNRERLRKAGEMAVRAWKHALAAI